MHASCCLFIYFSNTLKLRFSIMFLVFLYFQSEAEEFVDEDASAPLIGLQLFEFVY